MKIKKLIKNISIISILNFLNYKTEKKNLKKSKMPYYISDAIGIKSFDKSYIMIIRCLSFFYMHYEFIKLIKNNNLFVKKDLIIILVTLVSVFLTAYDELYKQIFFYKAAHRISVLFNFFAYYYASKKISNKKNIFLLSLFITYPILYLYPNLNKVYYIYYQYICVLSYTIFFENKFFNNLDFNF